MDKSYYYRVLGIRPDATAGQIKEAYEDRVKRLKSADYADDPDYVSRKLKEAAYAYRVVTGSAAPPTAKQQKKYFEKLKDSMEEGDEPNSFRRRISDDKEQESSPGESLRDAVQTAAAKVSAGRMAAAAGTKSAAGKSSVAGSSSKNNVGSAGFGSRKNRKNARLSGVIIAGVILFIINIIIGAVNNVDFTTSTPEYEYQIEQQEKNAQAVERILNRSQDYDYYGFLDDSVKVSKDKIKEYSEDDDEVSNRLWGLNQDLSYYLDIDDLSYGIDAYAGEEDYYYEISDYEVSLMLAEIMGAPAFEEVAGMMSEYSNEIILDYCSYMSFLIDTASEQTDLICGEPVEYY